jgi:hypothetical protein
MQPTHRRDDLWWPIIFLKKETHQKLSAADMTDRSTVIVGDGSLPAHGGLDDRSSNARHLPVPAHLHPIYGHVSGVLRRWG